MKFLYYPDEEFLEILNLKLTISFKGRLVMDRNRSK